MGAFTKKCEIFNEKIEEFQKIQDDLDMDLVQTRKEIEEEKLKLETILKESTQKRKEIEEEELKLETILKESTQKRKEIEEGQRADKFQQKRIERAKKKNR